MVTVRKQHKRLGKGVGGIASLLPGPNKVRVGYWAGETDAEQLQKAIWNEFGTRRIPERPAVRTAIRGGKASNEALLKSEAVKIVKAAAIGHGAAPIKTNALRRLGVKVKGDIQDEIDAWSTPPNAPSTIAKKGSSNPLIDTGAMKSAVGWEVED